MATVYVSSVDGNDLTPPSVVWWNGNQTTYATVGAALAAATDATNIVYVASNHSEVGASRILNPSSTARAASVLSVDRATGALTPGATITQNNNFFFIISNAANAGLYLYGLVCLFTGTGTSCYFTVGNTVGSFTTLDSCTFRLDHTSSVPTNFLFGNTLTTPVGEISHVHVTNCTFVPNNSVSPASIFAMRACSLTLERIHVDILTANYPPVLFAGYSTTTSRANGKVVFAGCNLSEFSGTLVNLANTSNLEVLFRDCLLHGTITTHSNLFPSSLQDNALTIINCDSADTNTVFKRVSVPTTITATEAIYRNGGATVLSNPVGWSVATNSTVSPHVPARIPLLVQPSDATGSATAAVSIIRDSVTNLTDADVWLEIEFVSGAATTQGSRATSRVAGLFGGAPVDLATDSATWTGTGGFANPNKQKVSVNFSPGQASVLRAWLCVAVPSTTIYVDPNLQIS